MPSSEEIDALEDSILTNAGGPRRMRVDDMDAEQHSLKDQLDALDRLDERAARSRRTLPPRVFQIKPGGTV